MKYIIYLLLITLFFAGCVKTPSVKLKPISCGKYSKVTFDDLPKWKDEDFNKTLKILQNTCTQSSKKELFKPICDKVSTFHPKNNKEAREFFEKNFTPFVSLSEKSLATGYFEPRLKGSYVKTQKYRYPLYGIPKDLLKIELLHRYKNQLNKPLRGRLVNNKVLPYYSRKEINENALEDQEPICYVDNKIDLFFLQIQGSGEICFDDNSTLYVGYADQNGYPYHSIGKEMVQRGILKRGEVSLETIYSYLNKHPNEADDILNTNPSYIFFEPREQSATGSLGIILKEGRSVAVDRKNIPLGMPLFISTTEPLSQKKIQRMVFAHDTGGAIKGESRIDIFFGSSRKAKYQAGLMQDRVKLWMLVPNSYLQKTQVQQY